MRPRGGLPGCCSFGTGAEPGRAGKGRAPLRGKGSGRARGRLPPKAARGRGALAEAPVRRGARQGLHNRRRGRAGLGPPLKDPTGQGRGAPHSKKPWRVAEAARRVADKGARAFLGSARGMQGKARCRRTGHRALARAARAPVHRRACGARGGCSSRAAAGPWGRGRAASPRVPLRRRQEGGRALGRGSRRRGRVGGGSLTRPPERRAAGRALAAWPGGPQEHI
jgi:hypothetical protein